MGRAAIHQYTACTLGTQVLLFITTAVSKRHIQQIQRLNACASARAVDLIIPFVVRVARKRQKTNLLDRPASVIVDRKRQDLQVGEQCLEVFETQPADRSKVDVGGLNVPLCFQQFRAQAFARKAEVDDGVQVIDKRDDDRGG